MARPGPFRSVSRGIRVSEGRVERLIRQNSIHGRHKRRFNATTDSKHALPIAPNRLKQKLAAERPARDVERQEVVSGLSW